MSFQIVAHCCAKSMYLLRLFRIFGQILDSHFTTLLLFCWILMYTLVLIPLSMEMIGWAHTCTIQLLKLSHMLLSNTVTVGANIEPSSAPILGVGIHHFFSTIKGQLCKLCPTIVQELHIWYFGTHPKWLLKIFISKLLPPVRKCASLCAQYQETT